MPISVGMDPRRKVGYGAIAPSGFGSMGSMAPSGLGSISSRTASPSPTFMNANNLYGAGVQQNAEDYDAIMKGYQNLASTPSQQIQPQQYTPSQYQYQPSSSLTGAISNLAGLAQTGGYSEGEKADIRARGISPIRSIYAGAMRDVNRQRGLQGGYSPNYGAVRAKMAREMSDLVSGRTTDINAQLAQSIAGNRLAAASPYASAAGQESALASQYGQANQQLMNEAQRYNIESPIEAQKFNISQDLQRQLAALSGKSSLYGTTPALASLFGNQALQSAQLRNQQGQGNLSQILNMYRGFRG